MKALDRKILRDLRLLWSQALTIALVLASGIGGFVACLSAVDSLALARDRFYAQGRFADVFVALKRAPDSLGEALRALPGIAALQTTVESPARVTVPGSTDSVVGQFIGLDAQRPAALNRISLRSGLWPLAGSSGGAEWQALVSEGFAIAHGLRAGDHVQALINGRQRVVRITGIALSPEYIFAGLWGMPDARGFGVFWVDRTALAAALDMGGAFNHVAFQLAPHTVGAPVLAVIDRQLARVGGLPAVERRDQTSHAMLDNEIREQRVLGTLLPSIFLAVSAFLIHVVVARLVATQREQVAALKALGYRNRNIVLHYLKLVTPIVLAGYLLGLLLGKVLGAMLAGLYAELFHFPDFCPPRRAAAAGHQPGGGGGHLGAGHADRRDRHRAPVSGRGHAPGGTRALPPRLVGASALAAHRAGNAHDFAQCGASPAALGRDGVGHCCLGGDCHSGQLLPRCDRGHRRCQLHPGAAR
jgi:putative ABC transport system permease protein